MIHRFFLDKCIDSRALRPNQFPISQAQSLPSETRALQGANLCHDECRGTRIGTESITRIPRIVVFYYEQRHFDIIETAFTFAFGRKTEFSSR